MDEVHGPIEAIVGPKSKFRILNELTEDESHGPIEATLFRVFRGKGKHPLITILFIAVIAFLCGVDDFVGMNLVRQILYYP